MTDNVNNETTKRTLTAGAGYGAPVFITDIGATVTAIPGGGGTMDVQYTTSTQADINAALATWQNWPRGTVSATASETLLGRVTAVKARAITQDGVLEVCQ